MFFNRFVERPLALPLLSIFLTLECLAAAQVSTPFELDSCVEAVLSNAVSPNRLQPFSALQVDLDEFQPLLTVTRTFSNNLLISNNASYSKDSLRFLSRLPLRAVDRDSLHSQEIIVIDDWMESGDEFVLSDSIRVSFDESEIKMTQCCVESEYLHWKHFLARYLNRESPEAQAASATLIKVKGIGIIGAAKRHGDPTFIALSNVVNSSGHYVLIKGGIYNVEEVFFQTQLRPIVRSPNPIDVVTVESFVVSPGRFVNAINDDLLNNLGLADTGQNLSNRETHRRRWRSFLRNLDRVRDAVNAEFDSGTDTGAVELVPATTVESVSIGD